MRAGYTGTGTTARAGYWKDGVWTNLGGTTQSAVYSLVVSDGSVYAGGYSGSTAIAGYWKDGVWTNLGGTTQSYVQSIALVYY